MIKLVVFDWNGTLLSDAVATTEADNHVLGLFGIKPLTMLSETWMNWLE